MHKFFSKNISSSKLIIIGLPVLLLLLSLSFSDKSENEVMDKNFNPYLDELPARYIDVLDKVEVNDSTFFCSVIEEYAIRELLIFKMFPSRSEIRTDFRLELYNKRPDAKKLVLNLTNDATLYKFKGKTYGVFRKAIPFIELEKLEVKQKKLSEKHKNWRATFEKPFQTLSEKDFKTIEISDNYFLKPPNPYISLFSEALELYDIQFLSHSYMIEKDSLFQVNKDLKNHIAENKLTIGTVENPDRFLKLLDKKNKGSGKQINFQGYQSELATKQIEDYLNGSKSFESTFDIKKTASFFALKAVFSNGCNEKIHFVYNSTSNLLEPFFVNSNCIGEMEKKVLGSHITDVSYIDTYTQLIEEISQIDLYESLIKSNDTFHDELTLINKFYLKKVFDYDILRINQRVLKKSLKPEALIISEIISFDENRIEVSIHNTSTLPIDVKGLKYKSEKVITKLSNEKRILSTGRDTIVLNLPRSFENLFVSKKRKETGFILYKDGYDLNVAYSVAGLGKEYLSPIFPYEQDEEVKEDLFRNKTAINNHKDIFIDKRNKTITFNKDSVVIFSPLIIPKDFVFVIDAGISIDIVNGGKIISYAPLNFKGTKEKRIKIFSSDLRGQGILVMAEGLRSNLTHVDFIGLRNPKHNVWNVSGAITFYESPVNLLGVTIKSNRCEDALNIVRTSFKMKNCSISDTQSDAFDGDFTKGTIEGSYFDNLGNDAIDVSGSDIKIINVRISNAGDKGLSAGEDSKMYITKVEVSESEIAVAGKDLSIVEIEDLKITNTKLGFTAFQKKPEFGSSRITAKNLTMDGVETKYLIENSSSLFVDGEKIKTSQNVIDRMYGTEFGRSSAETRNSQ